MNSTKNKTVIDGIITGDYAILKSFYKKHLPYVRKYIIRNEGRPEDVEDIFQDSLVVLYHKLRSGDLEFRVSIHSYFIGICKNMWRVQLRRQRMLQYDEFLINNTADPSVSVTEEMTQKDQQHMYYKHFTALSDTSKSVLALFFEGKSMREIANITGYTEGYTRKKKFKVKEQLLLMIKNDPVYFELVA